MKRYQKILVCIDKPERDGKMLDYAGAICRVAETKEVHLLHVATTQEPNGTQTESARTVEVTTDMLQAQANTYLKGHGKEQVICQIVTGNPLVEILRYGLEKDVDLVIIGRPPISRQAQDHETIIGPRIARKAASSVLVLPRNSRTKADSILVPVRYSECSANALDEACRIADVIDGVVCCLNIFPAWSKSSKIGSSSHEEHITMLQRNAQNECKKLLAGVDTGGVKVTTKCVPDLYSQPVSIILNEIENESADLVVIGARGRTKAAGVLLGKVPEELIRQSPIPVLAVKKKGECIGVLKALLIMASGEK